MKVSEKIFIEGKRRRDLEDHSIFDYEYKGKKYSCHPDRLRNVVSLCLDPIEAYALQVDIFSRAGAECDDVGSVIAALVKNAKSELEKWEDDLNKHIGVPCIYRVSWGNSCAADDLTPEAPVAAGFINYDS